MSEGKLELVGRVIGDLKPGDVVTVAIPRQDFFDPDQYENAEACIRAALPDGVKLIIHPSDVSIDVLRPKA